MAGLLQPQLSGFRNVPATDLPGPSFSLMPFFITETETPASKRLKAGERTEILALNPGIQKNRLE
jgi:hypothetical protein